MLNRHVQESRTGGSALVLALIVVVMVAALGAGLLQLSSSVTSRQSAEIEAQKAFYLAEAGLAEAFDGVRMGRTGQVGSETAPAAFGSGLLWVDATETADGQVRLVSTGLHGRGRATLSYVVEPVEIPLGFFSDEDLVVESVLLVDGFDSSEATYAETAGGGPTELQLYGQWLLSVIGLSKLDGFLGTNGALTKQKVANGCALDSAQAEEFVARLKELRVAYQAGTLLSGGEGTGESADATTPGDAASAFEVHTDSGGLLSSNGDVVFTTPSGDPVAIYGDVVPGAGGSVLGLEAGQVSGSTAARATAVELPAVEVPAVSMASAVRHDGLLPLLVPPGTSGHERIVVAADAELVLRGPATVVIGELTLEPGALLTLDMRDGDVELYVTGGMDLQEGSLVTTSSELPEEVSVQVAAIASGVEGAPVKLDATSQFHGTIYAPETEVKVGAEFEVYGGVVARKLEIGAGARLHFDRAKYDGSPIPRIVAWRIVEIPAAARGNGDLYERLGVEPGTATPLAQAHDLTKVWLTLTYLDHGGAERTFEGAEDGFDWGLVAEVVELERDPDRVLEEGVEPDAGGDPPPADGEPALDDQALLDRIADSSGSSTDLMNDLLAAGLLSDAVLVEAVRSDNLDSWDLYEVLLKSGPLKAGYPGAEGDRPLSDAVLLEVIASGYDTKAMSWTLEQNSPLSAAVLSAVQNREPPLPARDLNYILRWQ